MATYTDDLISAGPSIQPAFFKSAARYQQLPPIFDRDQAIAVLRWVDQLTAAGVIVRMARLTIEKLRRQKGRRGLLVDDRSEARTAVPFDALSELEASGLAIPVRVFRGAALQAVVTVGTDAATLVSLMQAPDAIRAFAGWVRARCQRSGESIELSARSGDRRVHVKIDGRVDTKVIADFLVAAMDRDNISE